MSIDLMSLAWKTELQTSTRMLLLALCDRAGDDGGNLYPSIEYMARRVGCSERTAQRLMHDLLNAGWIAVVGNMTGGAPGATRHYQLNVRKLRVAGAKFNAEEDVRKKKRVRHPNLIGEAKFADETNDIDDIGRVTNTTETGEESTGVNLSRVTNTTETGDKHDIGRVTNTTETGDTHVTLSVSYPSGYPLGYPLVNTPSIPAAPTALPAVIEALPALVKQKASKAKPDDAQDTELQAACKTTWATYVGEYRTRYGVDPVRNAKVNSNVKEFVKRIGHDEAPGVAAFYVRNVSEAFVVRGCHALGTLLQNAEAYRTQWATGQAMTNTRAQQADKSQSNFDAVGEAMAIRRAKQQGAKNAQ